MYSRVTSGTIVDTHMIRLWLSRGTSISVREQLAAQFTLGILSRKLQPGERLPSVRDLARRLNLHANTISAVYQDLADRGWVHARHGSGVFVRDVQMTDAGTSLEAFVQACIEEGLARGFPIDALRSSFAAFAFEPRASNFLVVDPDIHLAHIMAAEIGQATGKTIPFANFTQAAVQLDTITCALATAAHTREVLQLHTEVKTIRLKSMQDVLTGQHRPASNSLIAIVSRSESILHWASTLLSALGFSPDSVLLRNPLSEKWQDGLTACDIIAADVLTTAELPHGLNPITFRIVSDEFLSDFRGLAGRELP